MNTFSIKDNKIIINIKNRVCETPEELVCSELFKLVLLKFIDQLRERGSMLLGVFEDRKVTEQSLNCFIKSLEFLLKMPIEHLPSVVKGSDYFAKDINLLSEFVEQFYNFWRSFDRFVVCDSKTEELDKRPYRTFNETIEKLTHIVRFTYRNIEENITGDHPRIYRQVRAGAELAAIAAQKDINFPSDIYKKFNNIPIVRQILLYPPLVINQPMNKRTGKFQKIETNPINSISINEKDWLCYPAKVGNLLIMIYFNQKFFELGFSLSNLFELANDSDLEKTPDAVYFYGANVDFISDPEVFPTVFFDDQKNKMMVAAVPAKDEFGYFGYLKKMVLTLHNIIIMKQMKMPFHGALVKLILKGNKEATILIIGDTGAGKSETLEALSSIAKNEIQDIIIIADDMGSLDINEDGQIIGYGTEIGAFLRLDDLNPGYAFGQMDRSIIMNPSMVNARIVMPVTSYQNVIKGYKVDMIIYANNYESIDEDHLIVDQINDEKEALRIFKEGTVMSKGTTTSTGLVHSYFANVFGPVQYKALHDEIAEKYFKAFYVANLFVGQMRTRLGIAGFESIGPKEAATELLNLIKSR